MGECEGDRLELNAMSEVCAGPGYIKGDKFVYINLFSMEE